uniref:Transposon protein, putative, Mutator sub-class n=1 Tax=Oryza sativa subsp. japonica TaxID=39947 RepID=Q2QRJ2_ORYSJ|nr:hypothetical protein LOC_Os12g27390 [Oryza sativa Japonica Group]
MAFERSWPLVIFVLVHENDRNIAMETEDVEGPSHVGDFVEPSGEDDGNDTGVVQAMGMADEGERISTIVDEMEREDLDNKQAEGDASSDEEGDVMPTDWINEDFLGLVISEGHHVPWEYKDNEGKWKYYWKVSIVTEHQCHLQGVEKYHRNITSAFVASEMYSSVVGNSGFEPRAIIRHIEDKFKYTITYGKAWRAKQKVLEMRYRTVESSYDNLQRLLANIAQRNSNTYYDVHTFPSTVDPNKSVLQRAFFSLGACMKAFVHYRPVLCIDGIFLTAKYRGQILTAIGVDGNNQVLPMAFAFVESENTESWYWFLDRVRRKVMCMRPNVCLIHDRHAGMLRSIDYLQNGWEEKGIPAKWPDVWSRWCMRHMGANFYKQFKNKHLMDLFKRLCAQNQEKKFNELWNKLDELTSKQTDEQSRRPQAEGDEPPVPLGALHDDPPTMRRRSGSSIRKFSHWIENEPKEKWSLLFDTDAEVYNWVMRGVRELPLVGIVEFILHGTQAYFRDRYKKIGPSMVDNKIIFGSVVTKYMEDKIAKAQRHRVVPQGTKVHRRGIMRKHAVQECVLKADGGCSCTCMKPKLRHLPCSYVLAAAAMADDTPELLSHGIDRSHRSYLSAVQGAQLGTFRPRPSRQLLRVDSQHVCGCVRQASYRFVGLLRRDVSYLLGLPLAGDAVGPVDGGAGWQEDITERFLPVMRCPGLLPPTALHAYTTVGPTKAWLLQFTAEMLHPDADEYSVLRALEAYLLWLFGWVMFTNTHGHAVDRGLIHYARAIADTELENVPQWSWGSAVLAATYRALCEACTKTDAGAIFAGCPLLVQLWPAERFAIGRPVVDPIAYTIGRSAEWPEDGPTMGTYWCRRGRSYAHVQPNDVVWEPYTEEAVTARAPLGLSSLCTRDMAYWLMTLPMVFDIYVEPHCPQRMMRQFGLRQVDSPRTATRHTMGTTRTIVIDEFVPHSEDTYRDYLQWYLPRTRGRVTFTPAAPQPQLATVRDKYPTHRDRNYFMGADAARAVNADITSIIVRLDTGLHLSDAEQRITFDRMQEKMRAVMRVFSCRSAMDAVPVCLPAPLSEATVRHRDRRSLVLTRSREGSLLVEPLPHTPVAQVLLPGSTTTTCTGRQTRRYLGPHSLAELRRRTPRSSHWSHQCRRIEQAVPYHRTVCRTPRDTLGRRAGGTGTYRTLCNYIEWVDTENPENDGTRPYARSESRSDYLRRKDEHEHRIAAEALEWQVNPLGFPTWRERPECRCGNRCQVIRVTSIGQTITQPEMTTQFIQAWMEYERQGNPRRCAFTLWIDNVNPTYDGQKITESETQVEYQREKDHQNAIHVERRGSGR